MGRDGDTLKLRTLISTTISEGWGFTIPFYKTNHPERGSDTFLQSLWTLLDQTCPCVLSLSLHKKVTEEGSLAAIYFIDVNRFLSQSSCLSKTERQGEGHRCARACVCAHEHAHTQRWGWCVRWTMAVFWKAVQTSVAHERPPSLCSDSSKRTPCELFPRSWRSSLWALW